MKSNWRIWDRNDATELRTYQRATGELPEMESTKQLVDLVSKVYSPGMRLLDVGCAAGHYYLGLRRLDEQLNYTGVDATTKYIDFASKTFQDCSNADFQEADIFDLPGSLGRFDIVLCSNVILHLPDFRVPIQNLLKRTDRYCFIRTLIGDRTVLVRNLQTDTFDEENQPTNVVYQNTYSFNLLRDFVHAQGEFDVDFINDRFDPGQIEKEREDFKDRQPLATQIVGKLQISGNLVFQWHWMKITRRA